MTSSRSSLHEWIHSVGIIITFCPAGFSAWQSWIVFQLKKEDILTTVSFNHDCHAEYQNFQALGSSAIHGFLGLCWIVTISNKSENRVSILETAIFSVDKEGNSSQAGFGFHTTEEIAGGSVRYPVTLEGGAAHQFLVRAPVWLPASVSSIIDELFRTLKKPVSELSLKEVEDAVAEHNLDILGDSIEVVRDGGKISGWSLPRGFKTISAIWQIETGRGGRFRVVMHWPPGGTEYAVPYEPAN
jgi:hypothetical protein